MFVRQLAVWGVQPRAHKVCVLDNGLGDHIVFKSLLPEIKSKNPGSRIILAVCYPEVFEDVDGVTLSSIGDAYAAFKDLSQWNIYKWGEEQKWAGSLQDAFRRMYLP